MGLRKLQFSILGTLAAIFGLSTLFLTIILTLLGVGLVSILILAVAFNLIQWLLAPYLIDSLYRVREASRSENAELYGMVERLSQKSGIKTPRVMIADIPVPNAFAYGSPVAGTRVAVTTELMKTLDGEEVEAVIGHELGHLKHRDVQVMMFVSVLPALFYYISYSMLYSSMYRRGGQRDSGSAAAVIGLVSMLVYWVLTMFTFYLSRLREYYADLHSANIVEEGPRKLSEGLAKIVYSTTRMKRKHRDAGRFNSFKALFISDPDRAEADAVSIAQTGMHMTDRRLVEDVLRREVTSADRIVELFSTHPNIVKRLRALHRLD